MRTATALARSKAAFRPLFASETFRAAAILVTLLTVEFYPCIFGRKTLLQSSEFSQAVMPTGAWPRSFPRFVRYARTFDGAAESWVTEPFLALTGFEYWKAKTLPLWNPYQAFGQPYAANMQSQPFFPLTILFSFAVNPATYNLYILSRLFVLGFGAYLYSRLFVSFTPALAGGITAMLAGYFLLEISMPHLSVETLIPLALFSAELLLRKPDRPRVLGFALIIALAFLGGMPESTFLLYLFVYGYIVFRVASDANARARLTKTSLCIIVSSAIALGLVAFLLVPMIEFVHHSFNTHEPAKNGGFLWSMQADPIGPSMFTYLFPLLFGQPFAATLAPGTYSGNGTINYFGAVALFLTLLSLIPRPPSGVAAIRQIRWFFVGCAIATFLKRYNLPPLSAIDKLPVFNLINFAKYDEPILSVSIAILAAFGLERILSKSVAYRTQLITLGTVAFFIPVTLLATRTVIRKELVSDHVALAFPVIAIIVPSAALLAIAICCLLRRRFGMRLLSVCILCALTAELSFIFIVPLYYTLSELPERLENTYRGAPYIDWLRSHTSDNSRVFARDGLLFTDWASAFQLADIRDLDALYYWKYLPFIRNFVPVPSHSGPGDLSDRFTGTFNYRYDFSTSLERRLLQLSSTRYLITDKPYTSPDFALSYAHETNIYTYEHVLPRAALYSRVDLAQNDAATLDELKDPAFDPFGTVVLNRAQVTADQIHQLSAINQGPISAVHAARIVKYSPRRVDIETGSTTDAVLMLNDSDYPGWKVTVDGATAKMLTANFMFRAVLVPAGSHRVCFSYTPRTFVRGAAISMLTLAGVLIWCLFDRKPALREAI